LNADNSPVAVQQDKDHVALVNNAMHSIFSDVALYINAKPVEGVPDGMYPYRAYISNLFKFSREAQVQQLFSQGFLRDDPANMETVTNSAFVARKAWNVNGAIRQFYGKLNNSFFQTERLLMPGVDFLWRLDRAKDAFAIFNPNNPLLKPKVVITEAKLHLLTVKAHPEILKWHAASLASGVPAIYEFHKVIIDTFPFKAASTNDVKDQLFHGRVPKFLAMFMVSNSAFHGDYTKIPFNFKHYNLKSLMLTRDDERIPYERFEPDFKNGNCLEEYMAQHQSSDLLGKNAVLPITYDEFKSGYTIFQWNLSDNRKGVNAAPYQCGNVAIDFSFGDPTPEAMVMVLYGILDSTEQVFANDEVLVDGIYLYTYTFTF